MLRSACRFLAVVSVLLAAASVEAAQRPRYGGTLRVQLAAAVRSLDPAEASTGYAEAVAKERLAGLVFERLVRLDERGQPQPWLALSWRQDRERKGWRFALRPGVKFHDGHAVDSAAVVAALGGVTADGNGIRIESAQPLPELLSVLASSRRSIFRRSEEGRLSGTGPFRIAEWEPGRRARLAAHQEYWGGRPFLDAVSVEMGRAAKEQLIDVELGKADLVEIPLHEARRSTQRGIRIWTTRPLEVMALLFERGRPAGQNARLRLALALSIDRAAIHSVLLQRQGEPAAALLPQWMTGYTFLFSTSRDLARARQLVSPPGATLALACDGSDPLARSIAGRIALDAREAGLAVQVSAPSAQADLRLERFRLGSPAADQALSAFAALLEAPDSPRLPLASSPESLYAAERALLEDNRVIPLFHLPEFCGAGKRVKFWNAPAVSGIGEWLLENIWLEAEKQ